jgi:L-malate glycosyltransferase
MSVLYLNHTARVSGGELSLLDLVKALPGTVEPHLASPPGELARLAEDAGVPHTAVPGTEASLKLGALDAPRAGMDLLRAATSVRRLAADLRPDVIHANSIRAGVVADLATLVDGLPVVVHVRDCLPPSALGATAIALIARRSAALVTNSDYTRSQLRLPRRHCPAVTIHSGVDLSRFDPRQADRAAARAQLGVPADATVLGLVGQLTPWKGQLEAVETVALLRERGRPVKLVLVGSMRFDPGATRYDNAAYVERLHERIGQAGLSNDVMLVGHLNDVAPLMAAFDIALVPSWQEPMGRTVLEAMALELPVIATSIGGPRELIEDRVTGRLVAPRRPELWADVIEEVADAARDERAAMGATARLRALELCDPRAQVDRLLELYEGVSERPSAAL